MEGCQDLPGRVLQDDFVFFNIFRVIQNIQGNSTLAIWTNNLSLIWTFELGVHLDGNWHLSKSTTHNLSVCSESMQIFFCNSGVRILDIKFTYKKDY